MPELTRRVAWGVVIVAVLLLCGGLFVLHQRQAIKKDCDQVLYGPLKDHLLKDVFKQFVGGFDDMWISKSAILSNKCSFFSMRQDGLAAQGFRNSTGNVTMAYSMFMSGSNGVISVHPENNVNVTTGKIYPLYSNEFVLGNVMCEEKDGKPQWKSVISVRNEMVNDGKTASLVAAAVKTFNDLGKQLGLPLGDGENYLEPCYEKPVWRDPTKNSSY